MAMTYSSLIAAKGTAGSISNWVNYTKLDTTTILDEAQALLYSQLRTREMRTRQIYAVSIGQAHLSLPTNFLDPVGAIRFPSLNVNAEQRDVSFVRDCRTYSQASGTLGANPFTTANTSSSVTVTLAGHGLTQDSVFTTTGAATFNGVSIVGAFPVSSIIDTNNFTIDISILGAVPNASGAGGGAVATYATDGMTAGTPIFWAIWDEQINFDFASTDAVSAELHYYRSLPLLSSTNQSNFLTDRYPALLRTACQASAADFMKDDTEYQKAGQRLAALIQAINVENDGAYRGMAIYTETP